MLSEMLLRSSLRTAGHSILGLNGCQAGSRLARMFSAAVHLSKEDVEHRVLGVLRAFDRVTKDKVASSRM